jgi:hypothetical protein
MGLGPSQSYLCKYNDHVLPGYVQDESFDSVMNIAEHYGAYLDGSNSEQTGLSNKTISVTLKVWEQDYLTCKDQVRLAATMLRSNKQGFAPLYIQRADRHYEAMVKTIREDKTAGASVRTLDYGIDFECKPWLIGDTTHSVAGTGTVQITRTLDDGGWTPTRLTVTGTNVTVSGYTATGDFAGYVSISGAVTNLYLDSEAYTATIGGINKSDLIKWVDFRTYVGPGTTTFVTTGASSMLIEYEDRWYL